jgi:hypothetical protein
VDAPGQDYAALQAMYNKVLHIYAIQYVDRAMHNVGNGYVDLPPTCVLITIGLKYPYREGVYMGVMFLASDTFLPTIEQLYIDAEMALCEIRTEYNRKTDSYGLDPEFPSNCTIGSLDRGYVEKKYSALYASGCNYHLLYRGMYESAAY